MLLPRGPGSLALLRTRAQILPLPVEGGEFGADGLEVLRGLRGFPRAVALRVELLEPRLQRLLALLERRDLLLDLRDPRLQPLDLALLLLPLRVRLLRGFLVRALALAALERLLAPARAALLPPLPERAPV